MHDLNIIKPTNNIWNYAACFASCWGLNQVESLPPASNEDAGSASWPFSVECAITFFTKKCILLVNITMKSSLRITKKEILHTLKLQLELSNNEHNKKTKNNYSWEKKHKKNENLRGNEQQIYKTKRKWNKAVDKLLYEFFERKPG